MNKVEYRLHRATDPMTLSEPFSSYAKAKAALDSCIMVHWDGVVRIDYIVPPVYVLTVAIRVDNTIHGITWSVVHEEEGTNEAILQIKGNLIKENIQKYNRVACFNISVTEKVG